jgi:hypothetical protein
MTTDNRLSEHSAALARRAEMTRTLGRDPGPQPGELTDAEQFEAMTAADAFLRASFEAPEDGDHRFDGMLADPMWASLTGSER